jgi:tetratricopeptide (TPR) repeat protein
VTRSIAWLPSGPAITLLVFLQSATAWSEAAGRDPSTAEGAVSPIVEDADDVERVDLGARYAASGRRALAEGRYAEAVRDLRASYRMVNIAGRLFELADALEHLGRRTDAARALEDALIASPETASGRREEIEDRIERLRSSGGSLTVRTTPEDGWVILDGRLLGLGPIPTPLPIESGEHRIEAERGDLRAEARRFVVSEGESLSLTLELRDENAPEARRDLGLDLTFWATTSLAAAGTLAVLMVGVFATEEGQRLSGLLDITSEDVERYESLRNTLWSLVGVTGALTVAAVILAVVRGRRERRSRAGASAEGEATP